MTFEIVKSLLIPIIIIGFGIFIKNTENVNYQNVKKVVENFSNYWINITNSENC